MKISVALTSYNGERFIREQLRSIAGQTRLPDEVILCDDASTDGTVEVIRRFLEEDPLPGWKLTVNEKNIGYIANFRQALSLCGGDLVFLSDQDDVWHPEKIERMEALFRENGNIAALATAYEAIDAEGKPVPDALPLYRPAESWKEGTLRQIKGSVFYSNIAQGCACAYRRDVAEEYLRKGADCALPHDWALNLLAFERGGLYYWKERLFSYRLHGENTTGALRAEDTVLKRTETLRRFETDVRECKKLLSGENEKSRTERYADFIRHRIDVAEQGGLGLFLKGLCMYPRFLIENSFYSYCKDYAVSLKK